MVTNRPFNVVLVEPEIPPNTGTTARLCGATDSVLHLVKPLGFSTDDKQLKRAGLDYWHHVEIVYWESFDEFLAEQDEKKLYFFTKKTGKPYSEPVYKPGDFLIFGRETKGLPEEMIRLYKDRCYTIPMSNPKIRSLNLANAVSIVLYEALRQQSIW